MNRGARELAEARRRQRPSASRAEIRARRISQELPGWPGRAAQVMELRPQPHRSNKRFAELGPGASRIVRVGARPSDNGGDMSGVALGQAAALRAMSERDRLSRLSLVG